MIATARSPAAAALRTTVSGRVRAVGRERVHMQINPLHGTPPARSGQRVALPEDKDRAVRNMHRRLRTGEGVAHAERHGAGERRIRDLVEQAAQRDAARSVAAAEHRDRALHAGGEGQRAVLHRRDHPAAADEPALRARVRETAQRLQARDRLVDAAAERPRHHEPPVAMPKRPAHGETEVGVVLHDRVRLHVRVLRPVTERVKVTHDEIRLDAARTQRAVAAVSRDDIVARARLRRTPSRLAAPTI